MLKTYNSLIKQTNPAIWINSSNYSSLSNFLAYQAGTTGTGTIGTNSITAATTITEYMFIGQKFRIGLTDVYTVSNLSGTTITTVETLTSSYLSQQLYYLKNAQTSDSSGNLNNISNAVASTQPTYVESSPLNSKPSLGFNSNTSVIQAQSSSSIDDITLNGGTFAFVFYLRSLGGASAGRVFAKNANSIITGNGNGLYFTQGRATTNSQWYATFSLNTKYVVVITYNQQTINTAPVYYLNSTTPASVTTFLVGSGAAVSDAGTIMYLGNAVLGNRGLDGFISEFMAWKRVLSATEISMVLNNLGKKYGVTIS